MTSHPDYASPVVGKPSPVDILSDALRGMWGLDVPRSRTLARLVQHKRQIEQWWKCEVAAHLWDVAGQFGDDTDVYLENFDRADIAIAAGEGRTSRTVCIPIELKMIGTFWGRGNVEKAYREPGKKRLEQDMLDARRGRRDARPFAAVALLVTHVGARTDATLDLYLRRARELGEEHTLQRVVDEPIVLPADEPSEAHQFLWVAPALSP